jgi:hypothetical protein
VQIRRVADSLKPGTLSAWIFGLTVFAGSFLLFLVEPLVAKMLLPSFGGTAAVWLAALVFFQTALLLGYWFADLVGRKLSPSVQAGAFLSVLAAACLVLPVGLSEHLSAWLAATPPVVRLLALLVQAVGLPFVALSATGPLMQTFWARARRSSPYRLYALSNIGSLAGLISYPFVVEPLLGTHAQSVLFSAGFVAFAACSAAAAMLTLRASRQPVADTPDASREDSAAEPGPSRRDRTFWLILPGCSSALLVSITSHLTQNLAPVPLLWMLPLAGYLASFVACFEVTFVWPRSWLAPAAVISIAGIAYSDRLIPGKLIVLVIAAVLSAFFFCCFALHAELVRLRPPARSLTRFYLSISVGSAIGSFFAAIVIPAATRIPVELEISTICSGAALIACWWNVGPEERPTQTTLQRLGLAIGLLVVSGYLIDKPLKALSAAKFADRNFYGALRVKEEPTEGGRLRILVHGTTTHGAQLRTPDPQITPTSYYMPTSGVGRAMQAIRGNGRNLRIGVVGLGAGVFASYCRPGDQFVFFEINPLVETIARSQFTFLASCPDASVRLGDARLLLEAQPPLGFDLLVIDAFSGDAVPVHLLTEEAFRLFARHLAPNGVLAVNVSNRYLRLGSVIKRHARVLGFSMAFIDDDGGEEEYGWTSDWVILSPIDALLRGQSFDDARSAAEGIQEIARPWTDDYSNIASILRRPREN